MDLYVLDQNLDSVIVIDSYASLIWSDRFQECGDFELIMPANKDALTYLKQDFYLWSAHSEHLMIIEKILINADEEAGSQLTVTGRSLESILDRRVVWGMKTLTGNFQNGMREILEESIISPSDPDRKIENFVFKESTDPRIADLGIENQYTGDNVYDVITSQCAQRGIGFKVTVNEQKQFVFEFYVGADRSYDQFENPYVIFSPNFENILDSNYMESKSGLKNVTLVGGEGEGSARRYTAVGTISGLERRELFTDARDISSDIDDTFTEAFNFSQYPSQVFNNASKAFVSDSLFNSARANVAPYAGRKIKVTIPKYTKADSTVSNYATILVNGANKYVSTLQVWEKYDDSPDTKSKGSMATYEFVVPDDAEYLYTSMFSEQAITDQVFSGYLDDFEAASIQLSNEEYVRMLRQKGKNELAENKDVVSFEGQAEATTMFKYGSDFLIGDIVQVADEYGHETPSQILEVIVSDSAEGRTLYPTFATLVEAEVPELLPEGYRELEYIESTGTQWINTLYMANNNTRVMMDVQLTNLSANAFLFEGRNEMSDKATAVIYVTGSPGAIVSDYGSSSRLTLTGVSPSDRLEIDKNKNVCTINGVTVTNTANTFQSSYNLVLLASNTTGVIANQAKAKLYSCRIYDDGTLIRYYIPCVNPDGRVGLYDIVNEKFYNNSGPGEFIAGEKGVEAT